MRYAELEATHMRAYVQYIVKPYAGAIVLFRAENQPPELSAKPKLGWEAMCGAVEVVPVPGDHRGMIESPSLVAKLSAAILRAQAGPASVEGAETTPAQRACEAIRRHGRRGRSAHQLTLRGLWKELLGVDVGPQDNFFDLGGTSLKAIQLSRRLGERCGIAAEALDVFRYPTVAALAAQYGGGGGNTALGQARQRAAMRRWR